MNFGSATASKIALMQGHYGVTAKTTTAKDLLEGAGIF
jgi:hypothetical protein